MTGVISMDAIDRTIVTATQSGLPLCSRPYHAVAEDIGLEARDVMNRIVAMQARGAIRRIGAVPNHYALGYRSNGMSVWNVPDELIGALGATVGALEFVTHCYRRPRNLPDWPYNLFAMVHGKSRDDVHGLVAEIAAMLGDADQGHDVLFSTRILKKTGLRLTAREN
jgi:DNA-binding Lrp family transcriptional regulator